MQRDSLLLACAVLSILAHTAVAHGASSFHKKDAHKHSAGLKGFDTDDDTDPDNQLKNENFIRNAEHIKEHLKGSVDFDPDKASPEELDFHFFKIYDTNSDNKLDGIELMAAIAHGLDDEYDNIDQLDIDDEKKEWKRRVLKNKAWIAVDRILREDDKNQDGYIAYDEYAYSRRASKTLRESIV